jgi:hypothetical protein
LNSIQEAIMNSLQADNPTLPARASSHPNVVYHPDVVAGRLIGIGGLLVLMVLAAAWSSGLASLLRSNECRSWPALPVFGETDASMVVRGSVACPIAVQAPSLAVDELKMTTLPANGTVTARGRTGVTYRPGTNFKGEDFFAFTMRGHVAAQEGTALVRVRVTVQ